MVQNAYVKCKYCDTAFRLRTQIGQFNCPVFFVCPECETEISGEVVIDNENIKISYVLNNATVTENDNSKYVVEQSAEFLQKKIQLETTKIDVSPFIRSGSLLGGHEMKVLQKAISFVLAKETSWRELKAIKKLLDSGKFELAKKQLSEIAPTQ
jgi:hypothetical protein